MSKRKLILTQEQINEIVGYCDGAQDDYKENGSTEVFSVSSTGELGDEEYGNPSILDKMAHDLTPDMWGPWRRGGVNGALYSLSEGSYKTLTKEEFKKKRLNEDNQDFSSSNKINISNDQANKITGFDGVKKDSVAEKLINGEESLDRLADIMHDFKMAKIKYDNGDSSTWENMGGKSAYEIFKQKYESAKKFSSQKKDAKPNGQKIKSAPKEKGNGKAHLGKKEIINFEN